MAAPFHRSRISSQIPCKTLNMRSIPRWHGDKQADKVATIFTTFHKDSPNGSDKSPNKTPRGPHPDRGPFAGGCGPLRADAGRWGAQLAAARTHLNTPANALRRITNKTDKSNKLKPTKRFASCSRHEMCRFLLCFFCFFFFQRLYIAKDYSKGK